MQVNVDLLYRTQTQQITQITVTLACCCLKSDVWDQFTARLTVVWSRNSVFFLLGTLLFPVVFFLKRSAMSPFSTAGTVTCEADIWFDLDESGLQDGKAAGWLCFILKNRKKNWWVRQKMIFFFINYWQQKLFLRTTVKQRRTACEFCPPQHYCSRFKMVCGALCSPNCLLCSSCSC